MNKLVLDKYKNDPAWAETIKLYSGLFDCQENRDAFIINISNSDLLLAAQCKTSSISKEEILHSLILEKCKRNNLKNVMENNNRQIYLNALTALIELSELDEVTNQLSKITKPSSKTHKKLIENIVVSLNHNNLKTFLKLLSFQNPSLFSWAYIMADKNLLIQDEIWINKLLTENISAGKYDSKAFIRFFHYLNIDNENLKRDLEINLNLHINLITEGNVTGKSRNKKYLLMLYILLNINLTELEILEKLSIAKIKLKEIIDLKIKLIGLLEGINVKRKTNFKNNEKSYIKHSVGDLVECQILKIAPSRIFVRTSYNNASIYIGELSDKFIPNIDEFLYNGNNIYIGQKITAKVISIDKQKRINLSLKGL